MKTGASLSILLVLARRPWGETLTQLSKTTQLSQGVLRNRLSELRKSKFVTRIQDPEDRREWLYRLDVVKVAQLRDTFTDAERWLRSRENSASCGASIANKGLKYQILPQVAESRGSNEQ
jgi:DNA-binding MarR family transcriptional regulator